MTSAEQDPPEAGGAPVGSGRRSRPRRRTLAKVVRACVFSLLLVLVAGAAALVIGYVVTPIPDPNRLVTANATTVYYSDGKTPLGTFAARNRTSVPLSAVSKPVQQAVIAAENRTFYTDPGFSVPGIVRALWNDVRGGSTAGGSTITQQYVKNYYLTDEQTLSRKLRELFITIKVERKLSKQEILTDYLNTVYYGRGAYGIESASQAFFGTSAKNLTAEQGALLASLLKAPSFYDPAGGAQNQARLLGRFRYVLAGMAQSRQYPAAKVAKAVLPKTLTPSTDQQYEGPRGYLLAAVRRELSARGVSEQEITAGGLRVTSTFDQTMQGAAEDAVKKDFPTTNADGVHVGLAAVEPGTGAVRAMYGGRDYLQRPFSDSDQASFQPGSSFKAFALAAMLRDGVGLRSTFTGDTIYLADGAKVRNEFNRDYGPSVSMLYATEESINTAFVDMTRTIGPAKVVSAAVDAGVPVNPKDLQPVPVVPLGVASESPLTMANAYATFAAGGERAQTHVVTKVLTRSGHQRFELTPQTTRAFSADVVRDVTYALEQVIDHGTGTRAKALDRPAAGKTGTHEDQTAWFTGYTPQLSASVGFYRLDKNGKRASLDGVGGMPTFFGGTVPAKMWTDFMQVATQGQPKEDFDPPAWIGGRPSRSPTPEPTTEPTRTATPTPTDSPSPTDIPTPTETANPTDSPTPEPTHTRRPTSTAEPTRTSEPTRTATPEPTQTRRATSTPGPTGSPTAGTAAGQ